MANPQACLSFPKRRLCNTVGGRFIDGAPRCCAVCAARSRAAVTTNFARSNQSWVLRALFAGAKSCALVNLFMICPQMVGWWLSRPRRNSAPDHGHLMAFLIRHTKRSRIMSAGENARGCDDSVRQELATGIEPPRHWRDCWYAQLHATAISNRRGRKSRWGSLAKGFRIFPWSSQWHFLGRLIAENLS
jgi:hypothetical protein